MTWRTPFRVLRRTGNKWRTSLSYFSESDGRALFRRGRTASALPSSTDRLDAELARLAGSAHRSGICALHLETGRVAGYNAGASFPMASVVKIPLAVELLAQADSGALGLDSMTEVRAPDLRPGSGLLQMMFTQPRISLSHLSLLELMLTGSDNSAADILLKLVGGPERVNSRIRSLGIKSMRIDRSIAEMIRDFDADPDRFPDVRLDIASPEAVTDLLAQIWRGEAIPSSHAEILIGAMRRCQTWLERIPGMLPRSTEIAHKTGTFGPVANDVGYLTLPDQSHVALSIFTIQPGTAECDRDRTVAEIARAVFDYFLFTT